jgi:hypothetical protein
VISLDSSTVHSGAVAPMLCAKEMWMYRSAALPLATLTTKTRLSSATERRVDRDGAALLPMKKDSTMRPSTKLASMCRSVRSAGYRKL